MKDLKQIIKPVVRSHSTMVIFFTFSLSVIISAYIELFNESRQFYLTDKYTGLLAWDCNEQVIINLILYFLPAFCICLILIAYNDKILIFIDKYRYIIALIIFIISVFLCLNGSSLAWWYREIYGLKKDVDLQNAGVLFGYPRNIRSDEYGLFTPLSISQQYTNYNAISNIVRGTATDVTTTYGQPAWSIVTLFRPFMWGYLFLDSAHALSFFWTSRLLALFLVSYECAKIYTCHNKYLSASAAILLTFSPTTQWWFSTNGYIEMLIFGQMGLVLLDVYINTENYRKRFLLILALVECAGGFIYTYYPAQEIPLAYVFLLMYIWLLVIRKKGKKLFSKIDVMYIFNGILLFTFLSFLIFQFSKDTFINIIKTEYPGVRKLSGGQGSVNMLCSAFQSILLPFDAERIGYKNACETSVTFSLFPMGIILSLSYILKNKKDLLLELLLSIQIFYVFFYLSKIPNWLAQITLMSQVIINRLLPIIGIIDIFILLRVLALNEEELNEQKSTGYIKLNRIIPTLIISFLYYAITANMMANNFLTTYAWLLFLIIFLYMLIIFMMTGKLKKKYLLFLISVSVGISGCMINPIEKGTDCITNDPLVNRIREISQTDKNALWAVTDTIVPMVNLPILAGAPTINSTNIYPNLKTWEALDTDQKYVKIYNRYAHIRITLQEDSTSFELLGADSYTIHLNYNDLNRIGIKYILSKVKYSDKNITNVQFQMIDSLEGFYIYKICHTT
jgi:hypothetical protein